MSTSKTNDQNQNNDQNNKGFHPVQAVNAAGKKVGNNLGQFINKPFTIKGIVKNVGLLALGAAGATVAFKKAGRFDPVVVNYKVIDIPDAPAAVKISRVNGTAVEEIDAPDAETNEEAEELVEETMEDVTI